MKGSLKYEMTNSILLSARIALITCLAGCGTLLAYSPDQQPPGNGIVGYWKGTLKPGGVELRLVLHVT